MAGLKRGRSKVVPLDVAEVSKSIDEAVVRSAKRHRSPSPSVCSFSEEHVEAVVNAMADTMAESEQVNGDANAVEVRKKPGRKSRKEMSPKEMEEYDARKVAHKEKKARKDASAQKESAAIFWQNVAMFGLGTALKEANTKWPDGVTPIAIHAYHTKQ